MLGGIVIGMNAILSSQAISAGDYIMACVHLAIVMVVYVFERKKK